MQCTCKFCFTEFEARPQTKNPQACNNDSCQKARQRQNERDWHQKNKKLYDSKYHQQQRIERHKNILEKIAELIDGIIAGLTFKGISINKDLFEDIFKNFMLGVGLRQINKLYKAGNLFI